MRPQTALVIATAVGLPLVSTGCGAGWHRADLRPRPLAQREQALIYSALATVIVVHVAR